jgi:hypothetical protein
VIEKVPCKRKRFVIAKCEVQISKCKIKRRWIPAFAGMTGGSRGDVGKVREWECVKGGEIRANTRFAPTGDNMFSFSVVSTEGGFITRPTQKEKVRWNSSKST